MIYIKRLLKAEVGEKPRNIGLKNDIAESFFHLKIGSSKQLSFKYIDESVLCGDLTSVTGNNPQITGDLFSFVKNNATLNDLLVFISTEDDTLFEFKIIKQTDSLYDKYNWLMDEYGSKYGSTSTHLLITTDDTEDKQSGEFPLQRILYGAPGTGKSFSVRKEIAEHKGVRVEDIDMEADYIIRTTFHPDYDYAQFVGCYKPTKAGDKITYDFSPQVFTKALIKAYGGDPEKTPLNGRMVSTPNCLTFNCKGATYTINAVSDKNITTTKDFCLKKSAFKATWDILWNTGSFVIQTGPQSGRSTQTAVCNWINTNFSSSAFNNFDGGWSYLIGELDKGSIIASSVAQTYQVSKVDSDTLHITCQGNNAKTTLQGCYNGASKCEGIQIGIVKILKKYNEESFEKAWDKLSQEVNSSYGEEFESDLVNEEQNNAGACEKQTLQPVYLVIEEINRGNCAQIFGDIFQLLDRKSEGDFKGESEYSINVDEDLRKYLEEKCPAAIKDGKIKLPRNFNIIATMNTSDQSLFPMDSAFKRRWDWKYVAVNYSDEIDSSKFEITIDGKKYKWHTFLQAVNKKIKDVTKSEDKQMGNFFIKQSVNEEEFCNKVMFYLWNDVSKDYYESNDSLFQCKTNNGTTHFSFNELFGDQQTTLLKGFMEFIGCKVKTSSDGNGGGQQNTDDASQGDTQSE